MIARLRRRIDLWILRKTTRAAERLWQSGYSGFVYLTELQLAELRQREGMPESLADATRRFCSAMEQHARGGGK